MRREIKTPTKEGTISREKIKEVVKQNPPTRKGTGLAGITYIESWEGITNSMTIEGVVLERPQKCSYCRKDFEAKDKFVFFLTADVYEEGKIEICYEACHSEIAGYCNDDNEQYCKESCASWRIK